MYIQPPVEVTKDEFTIKASEIEPFLRAPAMDLKPWPNATIQLKDSTMFIRHARKDEVPKMLKYMEKIMKVEHDFYDIVGVRVYAELLGWYRNRLKDPYVLVGIIDGVLAGMANGRVMNEDINISHHTMTFIRKGRIGAAMYYAKAYYAMEVLGQEEFWSTFESYNGFMLGFRTAQTPYPWPEYQHELGGARVYTMNQDMWHGSVKNFTKELMGAEMVFDNIPEEIIKANEDFTVPEEIVV
jgi:hypothetical protein